MIGSIEGFRGGFRRGNMHRQTAGLEYYIAEEYWGKGITDESGK